MSAGSRSLASMARMFMEKKTTWEMEVTQAAALGITSDRADPRPIEDLTTLRIRYDDDPVALAVLDHVELMQARWMDLMIASDRKAKRDNDSIKSLRDECKANRATIDQWKETARARLEQLEVLKEKQSGYRSIIEQLAIATGQWHDPQPPADPPADEVHDVE